MKNQGKNTSTILKNLPEITRILAEEKKGWLPPLAGTFADKPNAAFKILISTVLSLRTRDTTTSGACERLFAKADTPQAILKLSQNEIEKLIFPVGFYRVKAANLKKICQDLLERFKGEVPDEIDLLLTLQGVGRKTANLVVTEGFKKLGICVDIHVHRISNRWGLVKTKNPDETEQALRNILPKPYWIGFNDLLVSYGQNLCGPVSPFCSKCRIRKFCPRIGVKSSR